MLRPRSSRYASDREATRVELVTVQYSTATQGRPSIWSLKLPHVPFVSRRNIRFTLYALRCFVKIDETVSVLFFCTYVQPYLHSTF